MDIQTKKCRKCEQEKPLSDFYKNDLGKYGVDGRCKKCRALPPTIAKTYRERFYAKPGNKEKQRIENKARDLARRNDPDYIEAKREWKKRWHKKALKENPGYKIAHRLRSRLNNVMRTGNKAGSAIKDLGCSVDELRIHLESKFQPGMSWENHSASGWHIDHIIPLAAFDLTDRNQFLIACHYLNLQPLWKDENFSKSDTLPDAVLVDELIKAICLKRGLIPSN